MRKFIVVNCGAIPSELVESELVGHKRGAFTHATSGRDGLWSWRLQTTGATVLMP